MTFCIPNDTYTFFGIHAGCSIAYRMSDYNQYSSLNSQTVEQGNSSLKRIKSSVSYMNKTNFMKHCTFYLWYHNQRKQQLLQLLYMQYMLCLCQVFKVHIGTKVKLVHAHTESVLLGAGYGYSRGIDVIQLITVDGLWSP